MEKVQKVYSKIGNGTILILLYDTISDLKERLFDELWICWLVHLSGIFCLILCSDELYSVKNSTDVTQFITQKFSGKKKSSHIYEVYVKVHPDSMSDIN